MFSDTVRRDGEGEGEVLTLDHVVVHCSENADLTRLKGDLAPHGIPFEPGWGKASGDIPPITFVPNGTFEDGIDVRLTPTLAQGRDFSGCRLENVEIALDTA